MINQTKLKTIEDGINLQPCRFCGQLHRVAIRASQNATHSSAICSTDKISFPTGDTVVLEYSEDSCPEFKSLVAQYVFSKADVLVSIPFDKI